MNERFAALRRAIEGEPLPAAVVDLDAVDANVGRLVRPVALHGRTLRVATKSVRCPALLRHIAGAAAPVARGFMCYSPGEAAFLWSEGLRDLLVAYPSTSRPELDALAKANEAGADIAITADEEAHLALASRAATERGAQMRVLVDVDTAYRPLPGVVIGVQRSPLHAPDAIAAFAASISRFPGLSFGGILAYEAHVAGLPDNVGVSPVRGHATLALKGRAHAAVVAQRAAIVRALAARGLAATIFNGGGSGSVETSAADPSLTEVAAGSGFLDSHLFDGYRGLPLVPAAFFVLQVTRRPRDGVVTCQSGGFIASGASGPSRSPVVAWPPGAKLTALEGAGEVQTPILTNHPLGLGDPVFLRHAKAGELAEHFNAYLLVRGDRIVDRARTYRGLGHAFH
ncbi:MAG: alanine racemase [Polyangiaceae bacterium]